LQLKLDSKARAWLEEIISVREQIAKITEQMELYQKANFLSYSDIRWTPEGGVLYKELKQLQNLWAEILQRIVDEIEIRNL
jgi:hypothetical protein